MPFVNSIFAWAVLGLVLIPILIYIFNRRRHRTVPWAAMRFLLAANRKSLRRTRFEQLLLLALRTLLMAAFGFALARPYLESGAAPRLFGGKTHHILVLDNSYSMAASTAAGAGEAAGGEPLTSRFDLAVRRAQGLLMQIPKGDPISILTMADPPQALNRQPTFDTALASRLLQTTSLRHGHADFGGALHLVRGIIRSDEENRDRAVYVFSDFAGPLFEAGGQSGDATDKPSLQTIAHDVAKKARIVLHAIGGGQTSNLANEDLQLVEPLAAVGRALEVRCTVRNYSLTRSADIKIRLTIDGRSAREASLPPLEPQEAKSTLFTVEFDRPGLHTIESTVFTASGNVLGLDDLRRTVIEVHERWPVLIVDGQPGASPLRSHSGYLVTALAPKTGRSDRPFVDPMVITERELANQDLGGLGVVILCNVRRLAPEHWRRLEQHVRQGGGLLVYLGNLVDIDHYNEAAAALLPGRLLEPGMPERVGAPPQDAKYAKFDPKSLRGSLVRDFKGRQNSGLFNARIHQYIRMAIDPLEAVQTLLAYVGGEPAIAERTVGLGRCVLVNTTANMYWNNLPAKGDFVTLSMDLLQQVAPPNAAGRNLVVGEPFAQAVRRATPPQKADLHVRFPDGVESTLRFAPRDDGFELRLDEVAQLGWYDIEAPGAAGPVAANFDLKESDLAPVEESNLRAALDCDFEYVGALEVDHQAVLAVKSEYASLILYTMLLILLVEALLAMLFGHHRSSRA